MTSWMVRLFGSNSSDIQIGKKTAEKFEEYYFKNKLPKKYDKEAISTIYVWYILHINIFLWIFFEIKVIKKLLRQNQAAFLVAFILYSNNYLIHKFKFTKFSEWSLINAIVVHLPYSVLWVFSMDIYQVQFVQCTMYVILRDSSKSNCM